MTGRQGLRVATVAAAVLIGLPATGAAHIDVLPTQIVQGQPASFTVRVPNERRGVSTTVVKVLFPTQVTVYAFAPAPPGWTMSVQSAPNGRISGVTYRGDLPQERYQDFHFLGNSFTPGTVVWKSYQTYADGKVKPWTTDPAKESDRAETGPTDPGPGSALKILPTGATPTADTAAAPGAPGAPGPAAVADPASQSDARAAMWLGIIGILIGAAGLVAAGLLWTTRPMRLPDDPQPRAEKER